MDKQEDVERLALACMNLHFGQSNGTPLTTDEWISKLMDTNFQQEVIDGNADLLAYTPALNHFFQF